MCPFVAEPAFLSAFWLPAAPSYSICRGVMQTGRRCSALLAGPAAWRDSKRLRDRRQVIDVRFRPNPPETIDGIKNSAIRLFGLA